MTPEDLAQLVPAFVGAALVILVVAGGILVFVWRQYPPPDKGRDREGLRKVDIERRSVKRGLRTSGITVLALGIVCLCVGLFFGQTDAFGPASLLVEIAVAVDGLIFLIAAERFSSRI